MSIKNGSREYALQNYRNMLREPTGLLKSKFIVPGSVYSNDLWDWDSWLTNIALRQLGVQEIDAYEKGCILNFLDHADEQGRIPIVVTTNFKMPNFSEELTNIHKPCLAQHAAFIVKQNKGDVVWLKEHFQTMLRYIDYYMNNQRHQNGLYYWVDDCAIGVDNDPCTFYRPRNSSGSIFLNCMMYKELEAIVFLGEKLGIEMTKYKNERNSLKGAIQTYCYDEKDGFYYSVDFNLLPIDKKSELHAGAPRHWDCLLQRIGVWSGFLAMWSGIATDEQAERMVKENLLDEKAYWAPHGVRTLSKYEKMYAIQATGNPSCWLGPVWINANYFIFRGLIKYGYYQEARELGQKTVRLLENDLASCGQMHEYYNPENGEPIMNPGFQNWNLLTLNMQAWINGETVVEEF